MIVFEQATITPSDTCTYSGAGDHTYDLADNCEISTLTEVYPNDVFLEGDAGSLTIASGGTLACTEFHYTPDDIDGDTLFTVASGGNFAEKP